MKILFLDIDGVLNRGQYLGSVLPFPPAAERFDKDLVGQLERVIQATGCHIVISSSWRELFESSDIQDWLRLNGAPSAEVRGACAIGLDRDVSILDWLRKNPYWSDYACVDDAARQYMQRVWARTIQTQLTEGLTAERANALINLLGPSAIPLSQPKAPQL